jgi:hypothetical protein
MDLFRAWWRLGSDGLRKLAETTTEQWIKEGCAGRMELIATIDRSSVETQAFLVCCIEAR